MNCSDSNGSKEVKGLIFFLERDKMNLDLIEKKNSTAKDSESELRFEGIHIFLYRP